MALRILLAEDNPTVARLIRYCLEEHGHVVTVAADGLETLSLADAAPPDLIITDSLLPKVSTHLACQVLRGNARTCGVPILALTDDEPGQAPPGAALPRVDATLRKPFTPEQLLRAVARFDLAPTRGHRKGDRV